MKTFEQLTKEQREEMIDIAAMELVSHIANGVIEITLANPESNARLEKILSDARKQDSMRLALLHILHDKAIRQEIYRLAIVIASDAEYTDAGDPVMKVTNDEIDQYFPRQSQG